MTTLAQYRTAVASKLGLDNSTSGDQTLIDSWVNEGVVDVMMRTDCQVRCATITLTAGTWKYALSSSILKIVLAYVTSANASYDLEQVAIDDIVAMQVASSTSISPTQYYAVDGSDFLMLYPTPAAADTLNIFYVPRPATLSLSSDSPSELPSEFHKAVELYALSEGADFTDDSSSQVGALYLQKYELWIRRIKRWVGLKGGHRRPLAKPTTTMRLRPFHDRSRYP